MSSAAEMQTPPNVAASADVLRTVAHEILLRLERTGIIEQRRTGRWYLLQLDATRIREHYEIRRHVAIIVSSKNSSIK